MKKIDIITIGGAVKDTMFYIDEGKIIKDRKNLTAQALLGFELEAKIKSDEVYFTFGGGAMNTAMSFSRLGFKTAMLSCIGDDHVGKEVLDTVIREKIDPRLIKRIPRGQTGLSFIINRRYNSREEEKVIFTFRGANTRLYTAIGSLGRLKSDWIYLTGINQENSGRILDRVFQSNAWIAWNPAVWQLKNGYKKIKKYLKKTTVLIINKDEALELVVNSSVELKREEISDVWNLLTIIKNWGPEIVIISDGAKGAWAFDGVEFYHQKAKKVKTICNTGAGDAFGSGFVSGLILHGGDIEKALKLGIRNGASVVKKVGAQNGLLKKRE